MKDKKIPPPLTEEELKEFMKTAKLEMAESDEIEKARTGVDRFLKILAPFMGWKDTSHVFVSDMSSVGDFNLDDEELVELSKQLGFKVTNDSYVKDIALTI